MGYLLVTAVGAAPTNTISNGDCMNSLSQTETDESIALGYDEGIAAHNAWQAEKTRINAKKAHPVRRTAAEIASDLQKDFDNRQDLSKLRKENARKLRGSFQMAKQDLELTMLKSGMPYECAACGSKEKIEVDHIHPISKGGGNGIENLQFLCGICNRSKGSKIINKEIPDEGQIALF